MRKRKKSHVEFTEFPEFGGFRGFLKSKIGQSQQVFMHLADGLARMLVSGNKNNFRVLMKQQYPQKLAAAVA
jgi:hypothetical protein